MRCQAGYKTYAGLVATRRSSLSSRINWIPRISDDLHHVIPQAEMAACVKLSDLMDAFMWTSAAGPYENAAYVSRESGRIWLVTDFDDQGDDPPEDVDDESLYVPVPSKNELDLGRSLALAFVQQSLPESYELVRNFFARAGAYARFKDFLDERGRLEDWYAYETAGVHEALRGWAVENGLEIVKGPIEG